MIKTTDLTLDVALVTHGPSGIDRISKMLPAPCRGVRYIVSWQNHKDCDLPDSIKKRDDVEIHRLDISGVANNRNNAIDNCSADIILIGDDDLTYKKDFAFKIIEAFAKNPDMDMAIFKVDFGTESKKEYPKEECRLSLPFPRNYYAGNIEIAFRRERMSDLRYWPELGLGANELQSGEDEFLVISAIKKGKHCRFINETICSHPPVSTGDKVTPGILKAQGFVINAIYGLSGVPRAVLKSYRLNKQKKTGFLYALNYLLQGWFIALKKIPRIPSRYRW